MTQDIQAQVAFNANVQSTSSEPTMEVALPTITAPIQFENGAFVATSTKSGGHGARIMRAKEWKEANRENIRGLSNKQIKFNYERYVKSTRKAQTGVLAAGLTSGHYGVEAYTFNKDGSKLRVTFVDMRKVDGEKASMEDAICEMPIQEREEFIRRLQKLHAADLAAINS